MFTRVENKPLKQRLKQTNKQKLIQLHLTIRKAFKTKLNYLFSLYIVFIRVFIRYIYKVEIILLITGQ